MEIHENVVEEMVETGRKRIKIHYQEDIRRVIGKPAYVMWIKSTHNQ